MGGVLVRYRDPSSYEKLLEMAGADPQVAQQIKAFDYGRVSAEEIAPLMRLILPDFPQGVTEYSAIENYTQPNEDMLRVIRRLKKAGLKVALVTNNGFWTRAKERTMLLGDISSFDLVVESCKLGVRKPDSEIFNIAVERLQVAKEECIFLDDSKENCEGAEREGIQAIYVENGNTQWAMSQLEHLLGISLSGRAALVTLGCEMNLTDGQVQIIEQQ